METEQYSHTRTNILILIAVIFTGLTLGIGTYTFIYAKGGSYLTNDPNACNNCHVMNDHFESWIKSSHHAVAVCNDCHTPEGFFPKYFTKASNGFWHSWGFTTGIFPDPLQIKKSNREITQESCRKCHREMVEAIEEDNTKQENLSCVPCHQYVGHQ